MSIFIPFRLLFLFSVNLKLISCNYVTTNRQAQKVPKFTCLKCLSDLNFGPGNSSNFASSHRKSWPSSLSDWCRCDFEVPPSAPSQQLISSSCSFGKRNNNDIKPEIGECFNVTLITNVGNSTANECLDLYQRLYIECEVMLLISSFQNKIKAAQSRQWLISIILVDHC